jgi:hypothetical protein
MTKYWPYFILFYLSAALLFPVVFTGADSFFIKQDNLHQAFPWYNKLAIALHKGYLPVWDANTFGGKNFAGEPQTGIFYPVNIIWCFIFGSVRGISTYWLDILVSMHYLLCLFGMYRLARVFRLPAVSAIASSLVFTFASAVGARAAGQTCIFFGLTWLPWGVYFIARFCLQGKRPGLIVLAGVVGGLQILAGHVQPFFHTIMIDGLMLVWYSLKVRKVWWRLVIGIAISVFVIVGVAFLISLPQLYYMFQYMALSYRTVSHGLFIGPGQKVPLFIYSHWFIIHPENFLNFLGRHYAQPDDDNTLYMGVLPLLLVILYLFWFRSAKVSAVHAGLTKLLMIILGIGLISSMGYLTLFYIVLYHIPFVNLIRQLGRYIVLISFSSSLLVGLGVTYLSGIRQWIFNKAVKEKRIFGICLAVTALAVGELFPGIVPAVVWVPYLIVFVFLGWLGWSLWSKYWPAISVAVIFVDILLNPVGYLPTRTYFYPDRFYGRNRIIDTLESTYGKYRVEMNMANYALMRRNLGDIYDIQTKNGYGATVNKDFSDLISRFPAQERNVDDLLNIRYVVTDKSLDSGYIYRDSAEYLKLYERKTWYPRCYWKHQLGEIGPQIENENKGTLRQLAYSDNGEKLVVDCNTPDTLIFSENYYPGWVCYNNGKMIKIYPATINSYPKLFRSIALGRGRHFIELRYGKPFHWF